MRKVSFSTRRLFAALIPLAMVVGLIAPGCGGEAGGLPSGIGGALTSRKPSLNIAVLNVGDSFEDVRTGVMATAGQNSAGEKAKSFEVVIKGAGVEGNDVVFTFDLGERPALATGPDDPDGEALFDARNAVGDFIDGTGTAILASEIDKRVPVFQTPGGFRSSVTGLVIPNLDATQTGNPSNKISGLRYAPTTAVPMASAGNYDVVYNFYTVPSSGQESPNREGTVGTRPFWRVLTRQQAVITGDTIYLPGTIAGSNNDPSRTYAELAYVRLAVTNVSPATRSLKVRVEEQNLDGSNSNVIFEGLQLLTTPTGTGNVSIESIPVVNRLRSFKVTTFAYLDPQARTPAIAVTAVSPERFIGVGEGNTRPAAVDFGSFALASRITAIRAQELVLAAENSTATFSVLGTFTPTEGEPDGDVLMRNDFLTFGAPSTADISAVSPAGTYRRDTGAITSDLSVDVPISIQPTFGTTRTHTGKVSLVTRGNNGNILAQAAGLPPRVGSVEAVFTETGTGSPQTYNPVLSLPYSTDTNVFVTDRGFSFNSNGRAFSGPNATGEVIGLAPTQSVSIGGAITLDFAGSRLVSTLNQIRTAGVNLGTVAVRRSTNSPLTVSVNLTNPSRNNRTIDNANFLFTTTLDIATIAGRPGGPALTAGVVQADQDAVSISADGVLTIPNTIPNSKTARTILVAVIYENSANEFDFAALNYSSLPARVRVIRVQIAPNLGTGNGVIK